MENFVELGATTVSHLTEQPVFDRGYDKAHKIVKGRAPGETQSSGENSRRGSATDAQSRTGITNPPRRRQQYQLPSPERDPIPRDPDVVSEISDRNTRKAYERETDDPVCRPEYLQSRRQPRRDSKMASQYGDGYNPTTYRSRSSQPPRSKYYDDDDGSDYDERSGRRYHRGSRGYDDRDDYDVVREETERYRGPVGSGPLVPVDRRDSYRSGYNDGPYGSGTVAQYGRRSEQDLDRSHVSRRSKSRGRDRDRDYDDRDYERSRSREGIKDKVGEAFDLSPRGLGVGLAGAVVGGLAGRQFGKQHKERDILIGALVGGIGANIAENKWHQHKEEKRRSMEREDAYDYGRSRSSMR